MTDSTDEPRAEEPDGEMVELRFRVPPSWRDELRRMARDNGQSLAAIGRMAVRAILRPKHEPPA